MDFTLARLLRPENDRATVLQHVIYRASFKKNIQTAVLSNFFLINRIKSFY